VLDSVPFRWPETVPTAFSGMLTLAGPVSRLLLAGQLDLISLRYTEQVDLVSFFGKLKSQKLEAKSFEKRDEWLRYDVRVHVPGNGIARIDNNVAKANLVGDLTLTGTNVHMGLTGTINAEDGSRGFFRDNEFTVSHAALSFTKTDRIAAILDVHAEAHVQTQTETYTVTLFVSGPVEEPEVQLTSDPSLARGDILSLLTIGVPASEKNTLSTMTGMSLVGEAVMNMSGLDKQIKKFLPKNAVLNNLNVHISTQYQEGSGTVEPTAQLEANFLTSDLKLRLSQPVISGRGRRVQMEGRVSDHVGVQLQWDDEAASGNSGGDLGVDVKLRWEFP
jgi:translocation and assembly module TamB